MIELHSLGQVRFLQIAQSGSTANLPADLATALATAKENDGRDFEAPKVEKTKVLQKLQMDLRQKKNY